MKKKKLNKKLNKLDLIISIIFILIITVTLSMAGGDGGGDGDGEMSDSDAIAASIAEGEAMAAEADIGNENNATCAQGNLAACGCDSGNGSGGNGMNLINVIKQCTHWVQGQDGQVCASLPTLGNSINICSPNQGNTCQSNPNLCGEQGIGTIKCNGICNANIPPLASNYGDSCKTTEKNECHMIGLGYIGCDNECSATIPLIGQCADPEISDNNNNNNNNNNNPTGEDTGFRTSDNRYIVVKDTIKTLVWSDISNATSCTVTGPEDYVNNPFYTETYTEEESINGTISGTVDTLPIQHKSKFTLTCYNGPQDNPNTPTTQSSFYINLVPRYQEI